MPFEICPSAQMMSDFITKLYISIRKTDESEREPASLDGIETVLRDT